MYLLFTLTALSSFLFAASAIKTKKEGLKVLLWVLFGLSTLVFCYPLLVIGVDILDALGGFGIVSILFALSSFFFAASAIKTKKEGLKVLLWVLCGLSFGAFALAILLIGLKNALGGFGAV